MGLVFYLGFSPVAPISGVSRAGLFFSKSSSSYRCFPFRAATKAFPVLTAFSFFCFTLATASPSIFASARERYKNTSISIFTVYLQLLNFLHRVEQLMLNMSNQDADHIEQPMLGVLHQHAEHWCSTSMYFSREDA